jgi:hypothetical protein
VSVNRVITLVVLLLHGCGAATAPEAGFWFEDFSWALDPVVTSKLGGAITDQERATIKAEARSTLEHAFDGLPLRITERRDALWRVRVRASAPGRRRVAAAGETRALGRFGAWSDVNFDVLAGAAVTYAPDGASRGGILRAIGRGIGYTATHELAHGILGPSAIMDQSADDASFEFHSFARSAQFYGELHWAAARPALLLRLSH